MRSTLAEPRRLVAVALGLGALILAVVLISGRDDGYTVKVEFADAGGVRKNSEVKIAEAPAGKVVKIDLSKRDTAMLTLKLDKGAWPIGTGASARSRPVNLLGEKYVDLRPGDLKRPMPSGTVIADSKTATSVEIDDVLNTLDPSVRARLRILINESGVALGGRGTDFNKLLEVLPHGLDEVQEFLADLSKDTDKLDSLVVKGDRVLASVVSRKKDLGRFIDSANDALAVTAGQRRELEQTVAAAPAGLRQLRGTLGELGATSAALRPAAANLTKTVAPLDATLKALPEFAKDTEQTLAVARDVAPALSRLGTKGTPVVKQLRPALNNLSQFATALSPNIDTLDNDAAKQIVRWATNWAGVTEGQDGISHFFRDRLFVGRDFFGLPASNPASKKSAPKAKKKQTPAARTDAEDKPASSSPTPETKPKPLLDVPKLLPKVLPGLPQVGKVVDGVTKKLLPSASPPAATSPDAGRSGDQDVLDLFDYLIGG